MLMHAYYYVDSDLSYTATNAYKQVYYTIYTRGKANH